ncbi:hypothetical protein GC197_13750 [bacterium]|nr:hypothetical protein [bacterium]
MSIRTLTILLLATLLPTGCRAPFWAKSSPIVEKEEIVDTFTDTQDDESNEDKEEELDSKGLAKKNGRSRDPGTGLSDRSREIERNLGFR